MTTTPVRHVSREVARRFLVLRHLLAPPRSLPAEPACVLRVVDRLGSLQFDPLDVAGRNHDLTLLARIAGYRREWTDALLYGTRDLYETYNKSSRSCPPPSCRGTGSRGTGTGSRTTAGRSTSTRRSSRSCSSGSATGGALSSTDVEPRAAIDWYWRPTNQVRAILEALGEAGILGISRREGNLRVYDLAERLFPGELLARHPDVDEQQRHRLLSRYRGHGLLGATGEYTSFAGIGKAPQRYAYRAEPRGGGRARPGRGRGAPGPALRRHRRARRSSTRPRPRSPRRATPDGWRIGRPNGAEPGVAFLAPLDPLGWDRDLLLRLWDFDYIWEVYVPAPKRRWGYYVLPLLYGDRFVGRIELRHDRPAGTLRVLGLWWEPGFDPLGRGQPRLRRRVRRRAPRPPRVLGAAAGGDAEDGRPSGARRGHPGPPRTGREGGWPGGRRPVGTASTRRGSGRQAAAARASGAGSVRRAEEAEPVQREADQQAARPSSGRRSA